MNGEQSQPQHQVSILIPSRGQCSMAFAMALRNLELPPFSLLETKYITGCFIDAMRNQLVDASKLDTIIFLDDDVLPPPYALTRLMSHGKDIVTGLYFAKQPPHFPQIYQPNKKDKKLYDPIWDYDKQELFEVTACGLGCLVVKREVFNTIGLPYFKYETDRNGKRVMGEDFYFCKRAREAGYKIYCDPTVVMPHVGQSFINENYWQASRTKLQEMEKSMSKEEWQAFLDQQRN